MGRRLIRIGAVAVWLIAVGIAVRQPASCGPWLSALALPIIAALFFWERRAARLFIAGGLLLEIWLAFRGVPAWRLIAPAAVWIGVAFLCLRKEGAFRLQLRQLSEREASLKQRLQERETEKGRRRLSLEKREASILEIGELYQLSKRFLATLDWGPARQITEEALAEWVPSLRSEERERYLHRVGEWVGRGQVSVEALIQGMPLAGTDFLSRERWSIVSGQLALGLQRVALYRQVQELATHDGLTGLLVRRTFLERLHEEADRALQRSTPVVFLMVDLDHFKQVNDTYGHLVGDVVLMEVASLIQGSVREMDLVGRYGGEEFGVVLPEAGMDLGVQIAERIRRTIEAAPIRAYDEEIHMTVSVGVALCPGQAKAAEELIEKADQAMYQAKGMGRNRTVSAE